MLVTILYNQSILCVERKASASVYIDPMDWKQYPVRTITEYKNQLDAENKCARAQKIETVTPIAHRLQHSLGKGGIVEMTFYQSLHKHFTCFIWREHYREGLNIE